MAATVQKFKEIYSQSRQAMNDFDVNDKPKNIEECLYEVTFLLNSLNDYDHKVQELKDILRKAHVNSILKTHDSIVQELTGKHTQRTLSSTPTNAVNNNMNHSHKVPHGGDGKTDNLVVNGELLNVTRVRLVQFPKNPNEPMGITLKKTDNNECLVARVIHGGMVHRQGTLHVSDEIKEINGIGVSMCSAERLQQILRDASGDVTFKIVPGYQNEERVSKEIYFKCSYDYDPRGDDLIPCQQAGLPFQCGDVIEVVSKTDMHWWQARKVGTKNVGLVPSTELQEHRIRNLVIERSKSQKSIVCLWPKKKNRKARTKTNRYTARLNTAFDRLDLVSYEEVLFQKRTRRRTIVLIGAHGVGRRHIKNSLVSQFPEKYAAPIPHTSRQQSPNERNGELWFFEGEEKMLKEIASHQYLEYGNHEGHVYGTKLSSVRDLISNGRVPVLDVETPTLKILRCKEFLPYIIFISSPNSYAESGDPKMDASLQQLIKDSTDLRNRYRHFFDYTIVNQVIDDTVEKIVEHLKEMESASAWIPASWHY